MIDNQNTGLNLEDIKGMTREEKLALLPKLNNILEGQVSGARIFYYEPFPWQAEFIEMAHRKMTIFAPSPNKIGKTVVAICIGLSWAMGYEPWNQVPERSINAVEVKTFAGVKFYRQSSLGIVPPVNIVVCGEDWKEHIGKTLIPEFKKWAPANEFICDRKNEQGIEAHWKHIPTGSTITFMCYTQDDKLFESSKIQGALMDEPPPKSKREGLKRGLFFDRGKEVITATPLSEVWLLDELILKKDLEVGVMEGLTILDNPIKYENEVRALKKMGLSEKKIFRYFDLLIYHDPIRKTCVKDKGRRAEQYVLDICPSSKQHFIQELDILRFVKATDPDKAPARFHGTFRALIGKIYKEYDVDIHLIKTPLTSDGGVDIKPDWLIIPTIDWHPGTEIALSGFALNRYGMIFNFAEIFKNMDPYQTADIIIKWKMDGYFIHTVIIDALARGDTGFIRNRQKEGIKPRDTFAIIEEKLKEYKIKLVTGSRDRDSGITNVQTMLKGPNDIPMIYFFDCLQSANGAYGILYEMDRWTRDEEGKVKEEYNHFLVSLGWVTLSGIKWKARSQKQETTPIVVEQRGTWMGG